MGPEGQRRLGRSHALVVGCGALGSTAAELLVRAGVGTLTLVDRDVVEWSNLQRQSLYAERDARERTPKAEAARRRLREINAEVTVHACVEHLDAESAPSFLRGVDVIVDGLDNAGTRYLLNDLSVKHGVPWIYAAAVGMEGRGLAVMPGGACLRCVFPQPPGPGVLQTCDTAGVFGPVVVMAGALAASQALKVAAGRADLVDRGLWALDLMSNRWQRISPPAPDPQCPCCGAHRFEWLDAAEESLVTPLCGRSAVQVRPERRGDGGTELDLDALAGRLAAHGSFERVEGRLQGTLRSACNESGEPLFLTVFPDGRAIVGRCVDPLLARAVYDRFIGG